MTVERWLTTLHGSSWMKRFWQLLALILLALMVPASACCLWPKAVEHEDCGCCSTSDQDHDAPAQPEVCPSDTIAHSQLPAPVIMPTVQMIELAEIIHAWTRLHELASQQAEPLPLMTTAPPELRTTWVFMSRAALPARAPSELV